MRITSKAPAGGSRGRRLVQRMRGRAKPGMSTDEIMALTRDARRYRTYLPKLKIVAP